MTVVARFEFRRRDGEMTRASTLHARLAKEKQQPKFSGSSIKCDLDRVEQVETSDSRLPLKIYWSDEVFGTNGNPTLLKQDRAGKQVDIALIEVGEGHTWIVRAEPTLDDQIGIQVSNESGKCLLVGVGDITPVEYKPVRPGLKPKKGNIVEFSFREVYSWAHSSPMGCAHCTGSVRTASPAAYPDYSAPDGGMP